MDDNRMTNEKFAQQDADFKGACRKAGVVPTARQASKYRNRYGAAATAACLPPKKALVPRRLDNVRLHNIYKGRGARAYLVGRKEG